MADRFHHTMNTLHTKLKFEIEKPETKPNGLSLSLLDFKVTISKDGRSSFKFYKKTAKKRLLVHHQSAIPKKSKINFIRNERKRIEDRCSTQTTSIKHQNMFEDILRINGYPEDSIDQTKHPQSHQRNSPPPNVDWSYLKIPYISERLNHKITNILRKEGMPARVAHRSYTLRWTPSRNGTQAERICTRDNCPTAKTKLCLLRNTVYQITCNNLQPTLHREHYTFHPRSCKRTPQ